MFVPFFLLASCLVPLLFGLMGGLPFFCLNHLPFATVHVQDITLFDPVVRDVLQVIFGPSSLWPFQSRLPASAATDGLCYCHGARAF
jgi:hypothetical protein